MAEQKELDRMNQAVDYFNRYFQFEDAVNVSVENKEYLKTYIHDNAYVVKNFDLRNKILKSISLAAVAALIFYALLWFLLGEGLMIVTEIACGSIFVLGVVFVVALNKYRLTAAENHQVEVNEGINEQIEILSDRTKLLEKQRDDYRAALEKRVPFMSLDYIKNADEIKSYLDNGQAETCEDAVAMFEQNLLMREMTDIISKSEVEQPVISADAKEKFGDPLKIIKENKRKKRKEKRAKKQEKSA